MIITGIQGNHRPGIEEPDPQAPLAYRHSIKDGHVLTLPPLQTDERGQAHGVPLAEPATNISSQNHSDTHLPSTHKQSVIRLLKEIFPRRDHSGPSRVPQAVTLHAPTISLSPVHSDTHLVPSAASSRASLLDNLGSQPSYVIKNHRRYRAKNENDIRHDQWQHKIQRVINED